MLLGVGTELTRRPDFVPELEVLVEIDGAFDTSKARWAATPPDNCTDVGRRGCTLPVDCCCAALPTDVGRDGACDRPLSWTDVGRDGREATEVADTGRDDCDDTDEGLDGNVLAEFADDSCDSMDDGLDGKFPADDCDPIDDGLEAIPGGAD